MTSFWPISLCIMLNKRIVDEFVDGYEFPALNCNNLFLLACVFQALAIDFDSYKLISQEV